MKKLTTILLVSLITILVSSCEKEEKKTTTPPPIVEGEIYYRFQYDLAYPSQNGATSCDITPGNYTDNNPAVPDYAYYNTYYGLCQPGTYSARFVWDTNASSFNYLNFTYSLVRPASGYKRYYTQVVIDYLVGTNRCHMVAGPNYLTYTDIKI